MKGTPFLKEKTNNIELEPDLTDPDADPAPFVQCGSAALVIRDNIHVRDLVVSSYQDPESTEALVRFHLFLKSYLTEKSMGRSIKLQVTDPEGNPVIPCLQQMDKRLADLPPDNGHERLEEPKMERESENLPW